jgi:glutamate-5-semialdehyde dehydrogenase
MREDAIRRLCEHARRSSRALALASSGKKNACLISMGRSLAKNAAYILSANAKDLESAAKRGLRGAFIDRLTLNSSRIASMSNSMIRIARLKDPVGETLETVRRPNGLIIKKIRVPIGVILIIYESRPNVTSDCAGLCLKSGNAVILRGGSDAINSNSAIFNILKKEILKHGLPDDSITMIKSTNRKDIALLLAQGGLVDLAMPRGGESLIREVSEKARMPVIRHYKGVCHTYVDIAADLKIAQAICYNAKVQRPGVCNAMETMLVHRRIAKRFLPSMLKLLKHSGVEIRGCGETKRIMRDVVPATENDWYTEYLDLILSVKVVRDVNEAIEHITKYGSSHSDAIVTRDKKNAKAFLDGVDSACVYLNASTRFTDGGEFGKGAEIGISTDKLHARGPMGLEELTSYKYVILGNGQVRG